jgi:hypothetical protein
MILRLWLGKRVAGQKQGFNVGREVSPATLWAECEEIRDKFNLKQTYASAEAMGRRMTKGDAATMLSTLAYQRTGTSRPRITFKPTPEVAQDCVQEYEDIAKAKRPWDIPETAQAVADIEAADEIESIQVNAAKSTS